MDLWDESVVSGGSVGAYDGIDDGATYGALDSGD